MAADPLCGTEPINALRSVLFPEPLTPTRHTRQPAGACAVADSTATTSP
jgi:hypothetical protein